MSLLHDYAMSNRGDMTSDGGPAKVSLRKTNINLDIDVPFGTAGSRFFNSKLQADTYPAEPWYKESFSIFVRVRYNDNTEQEMFSGTTGYKTISMRKTIDQQIEFSMGDNSSPDSNAWFLDTSPNVIVPGEWHTIICTYDKPNTTARIYIDGTLQNETTGAIPPGYVFDTWKVGMDYEDLNPLHATIAELAMWDSVLDSTLIASLIKRTAMQLDSNRLFIWALDETEASDYLESNGSLNISSEFIEEVLDANVPLEAGAQSWKTPEWSEGFLDG